MDSRRKTPLVVIVALAASIAILVFARIRYEPRVTPADIREAVELQNRSVESFIRSEQSQEVVAWILAHQSTAVFADRESSVPGSVVTTDDALDLVRRLYAAGSKQVLAVRGLPNNNGVRSGLLIAEIPTDEPERGQVLSAINAFRAGRGRSPELDDGQRYETLLSLRE